MQTALDVTLIYEPRAIFIPYHLRTQRYALTVAHRRAGKTLAEINECIDKAIHTPFLDFPPQVAFIAPTYAQVKRNVWDYLKFYTSCIPGMKYSENELSATFASNKGKVFLAGSDNPDTLRGVYLDHASLDEFGSCDPNLWGNVVRPALSDRKGSATFIGSARGRNHFYDMMKAHLNDPEWLITVLKASETKILSESELEDARRTMTPEQYAAEYECDFEAAVTGTYYGKDISLAENEKRIGNVPYDPSTDVYCAWDLGIGDSTALWIFQSVGKELHFLRCYENYNESLDHYVQWINKLPYSIALHILPHDALAKELQTGKSRQQFFDDRKLKSEILPRGKVPDGINAVRMAFPKSWFDVSGCAHGIDCLRMYQADYNEKLKALSEHPKHNWASHMSDAFRYACVWVQSRNLNKPSVNENRYRDAIRSEHSWMG